MLKSAQMRIKGCLLYTSGANGKVNIAIVGGGATGVELSAELHNAVKQLHSYGYKGLTNEALNVTLVEAGERILPALPPRISAAAHNELTKLGVRVLTQTMVTSADEGGLHTKDGEYIEADLMVWAAGIKAPDFLKDIGGLETNRINQLVVEPTLQTTRDPDIYAIGDCASCPRPEGGFVPPRAQAAHQMATCAMNNILAQMNGKPLKNYQYKDHGSLVSLSNFSTVGSPVSYTHLSSTLYNERQEPVTVHYRFYWYDARGLEMHPLERPRSVTIPAHSAVTLYGSANFLGAHKVRLYLYL